MLFGNNVLSIDPGNDAGAAIFADGYRLQACGLVQRAGIPVAHMGIDPLEWLHRRDLAAFDFLVIEIPRISKQTKNPGSIVRLSITAGRLEERYPHKQLIETFVEQWKGNVEKREHNARVVDCLYDAERLLVGTCNVPPSLLNNAIDGVGIGLRATGRMLRGKARGR